MASNDIETDMPDVNEFQRTSKVAPRTIMLALGLTIGVAMVFAVVSNVNQPAQAPAPAVDTALYTLAGFKIVTQYKCIFPTCTDAWCNANCNHKPSYCPASFCRKEVTKTPVAPKAPPPPPPAPEVAECPAGSLVGTYFSSATARGDSISVKSNSVCCPASCGTCGGKQCASRPGGKSACCADIIQASNKECGSPPCALKQLVGTELMAAPTVMYTLAGFKVTTTYKCIFPTCTDAWCNANCNHKPSYCPASFCRKEVTKTPVAPKAPPP